MDNINYIPDIFLQDGTVIEIKGYWDKGSLTKCYEYAQLNSNYYIIDSDLYYDLQKKYGKIVKDWTFQENILKIIKAKVVGINFNERKKYVENIKVDDKIVLKRETDNKFDKMAVKIENENGNQLGYLAKEWANIYARKLDIGMEFEAVVKEKNDSNLIIEIKRINNEQEKIYEILKG